MDRKTDPEDENDATDHDAEAQSAAVHDEENLIKVEDEVRAILIRMWLTLAKTNVLSVAMIALLILLIVLVLILIAWTYLFMESYNDPNSQSQFYRRLSMFKNKRNAGGDQESAGAKVNSAQSAPTYYGATNRAFDPTPETTDGLQLGTRPDPAFLDAGPDPNPKVNPQRLVCRDSIETFFSSLRCSMTPRRARGAGRPSSTAQRTTAATTRPARLVISSRRPTSVPISQRNEKT